MIPYVSSGVRDMVRQTCEIAIAEAASAAGGPLPIAAIVDLVAGPILDRLADSGLLAPPAVRVDAQTIEIVEEQEPG